MTTAGPLNPTSIGNARVIVLPERVGPNTSSESEAGRYLCPAKVRPKTIDFDFGPGLLRAPSLGTKKAMGDTAAGAKVFLEVRGLFDSLDFDLLQ